MSFARTAFEADAVALDDGVQHRTWSELEDRVWRIAGLLREELGVAPGEHAALLMENRLEGVELIVAALLAGIWITPINHHLAAEELSYVLADSRARVVFRDARFAPAARAAGDIYPADIEQVLQEHTAVADVAVFGIPDEEWGESVKAAVELRPGFEPSTALAMEILDFGRTRLARYKVPRSIDFETELPRHPTGKLLVRRLKEPYWRGHRPRTDARNVIETGTRTSEGRHG